jgi:4-hydroxybenzoate polyprenyltransferase
LRFKVWPHWSLVVVGVLTLLTILVGVAAARQEWAATAVLVTGWIFLLVDALYESGIAMGRILGAVATQTDGQA